MRILIVEDEPFIARRLEGFCRTICGDTLDSLRVAGSFAAATASLAESPIDVLLLDLNLGGEDGMRLLESCVAGSFHTIIVSAHTDQALRAFEYGVLDFVPKPCTPDRLAQAIRRVADGNLRATHAARYLAVRKHGRIDLIPVEDVLYVEGADKYSELVLVNGRRELHDKTLSRIEAVLPPVFERIHKSYIVRLSSVQRLYTRDSRQHEVELQNGTSLPVSRARYAALKELLLA